MIFTVADALGCEKAGEKTTQFWNSPLLAAGEGNAATWSPQRLSTAHDKVKKDWLQFVKGANGLAKGLSDDRLLGPKGLPNCPEELRAQHRELYDRVFQDEPPAICRLDLAVVARLTASTAAEGIMATMLRVTHPFRKSEQTWTHQHQWCNLGST